MSADRRIAAHEMLAEYAHRVDSGNLRPWSELFAPDGVMAVRGEEFHGPEGVYGFITRGRAEGVPSLGRHIITNIETSVDGDSATVSADFLHVSATAAGAIVEMLGNYYCTLTWQSGRWLFARHEAVFLVDKRNPAVAAG
jgi:hypothetical protein